jgi:hypothetical protein
MLVDERESELITQWVRTHSSIIPVTARNAYDAIDNSLTSSYYQNVSTKRWGAKACKRAASEGNLIVLTWLRGIGCSWDHRTTSSAASNGQLEVFKYARSEGCEVSQSIVGTCIESGSLDMLKYVVSIGYDDVDMCFIAAFKGQLGILKWAHANGYECDNTIYSVAADRSHLRILEWLYSLDYVVTQHAYDTAMYRADDDVIEWFDNHYNI